MRQQQVAGRLRVVATERFPSAVVLDEIALGQMQVFRYVNGFLIPGLTDADRKLSQERTAQGVAAVDRAQQRYDSLAKSLHMEELWRATRQPHEAWLRAVDDVAAAARGRDAVARQGAAPGSNAMAAAERRLFDAWYAARKALAAVEAPMKEVARQNADDVAAESAGALGAARRMTLTITMAVALGMIAMAALAFVIARRVRRDVGETVGEAQRVIHAVEEGTLDVRADAARVSGEFRPVIEGLNITVDAMARRFRVISSYMDRISRGDLPPHIETEARGEFAVTRDSINRCIDAIGAVVADVETLAAAGADGRLAERANASVHKGQFRAAVEGVNSLLDGVVAPMLDATKVLERLAARDLTARVETSYRGDHARIKDALNSTARALQRGDGASGQRCRSGLLGLRPDRLLEPIRGAGRQRAGRRARGDLLRARVDGLHDQAGLRQRSEGERARRDRARGGHRWCRRHGPDEWRDVEDPGCGREHLADHQGHQ